MAEVHACSIREILGKGREGIVVLNPSYVFDEGHAGTIRAEYMEDEVWYLLGRGNQTGHGWEYNLAIRLIHYSEENTIYWVKMLRDYRLKQASDFSLSVLHSNTYDESILDIGTDKDANGNPKAGEVSYQGYWRKVVGRSMKVMEIRCQ